MAIYLIRIHYKVISIVGNVMIKIAQITGLSLMRKVL
jgi:hypothetical protein